MDPDGSRRYLSCKGICLARKGRVKEALAVFTEAGDAYHASVLSRLVAANARMPKLPPADVAMERTQLLSFWQGLSDPAGDAPSSSVLKKLRNAYLALMRGDDPDPALAGLGDTPGFEECALYLTFLAAVQLRKKVRIRHLMSAHPSSFRESSFCALLDSHLLLLLKEKDYREIEILKELCEENGIHPGQLDHAGDELLFAAALDEIDAGKMEEAFGRLRGISRRTPSLIHNMALAQEKMGRLDEANENWITLLKAEGKPRRSDDAERRLAYVTAAKHVAYNYIMDDQPEKARRYFKEALDLSEGDREVLENLAGVSIELRDYQGAVAYARRLWDLDPRNPDFLISYLSALLARGSVDVLLPLVEEHWESFPRDSEARRMLANLAIRAVWGTRESDPARARRIAAMVAETSADTPHFLHMEGYFLDREGKKKEAEALFTRLVERTDNHAEQLLFGFALYDDGFRGHTLLMFKKLIDCGCEGSQEAFESIISFLGGRNDRETARELCFYAMDSQECGPFLVADILYTCGKSEWAREYSEMLLEEPDADEDACYLHLLILSDIGNPVETLSFAESMRRRFRGRGDPDTDALLDDIVKEVKTRGRVRIHHV